MYLSAHDLAEGRQHTLNNIQTASAACVGASERLSSLWLQLGRDQLNSMARQPVPSMGWLSSLQHQQAVWMGALLEIIGDAQQTLILASASQTRVVDGLLATTLDRARQSSPAEMLPALEGMRQHISQTEELLTHLAETSRQSIAVLETAAQRLPLQVQSAQVSSSIQ